MAELLDITHSTLRFWEKEFPQLNPKRNAGRIRLYTPADIEKLKIIKYLLKDRGLKIEIARQHLKDNPTGVAKKHDAVLRLKQIKAKLENLLNTLNTITPTR